MAGECTLQELVEKIMEDYFFLRKLSPKNELLKYFVAEENHFRSNLKGGLPREFTRRFWGDFPTRRELKMWGEEVDEEEYGFNLSINVLLNYGCRLQGQIQMDLMKN